MDCMTPERSKEINDQTGRVTSNLSKLSAGKRVQNARKRRFDYSVVLVAVTALSVLAQSDAHNQLPMTPPMGWNSWDAYGLTITEAEFRANAEWMSKHLKPFGWQYAVVDEGWYLQNPGSGGKPVWEFTLDKVGRFTPAPNRFPSAVSGAGFKPLADYVHSLGLRFGIHIMRGIPREAVARNLPIADSSYHASDAADSWDACSWNSDSYGVKSNPAGQAYYDSVAKTYASWGVDFIKVDCISSQPYKASEIRMISAALKRSGRAIVLSLSPGPTSLAVADDVRKYAQMWRISGDLWDYWKPAVDHTWIQTLYGQFSTAAAWAPYSGPGHWPDADMLPIGYLGPRPGLGSARQTRFSHDEERTLFTFWSIIRSPLMIGGNLTQNDEWTTSLLTNTEVIAVNQHSTGNRPLITTDDVVIWTARQENEKGQYLAIFNRGDSAAKVALEWNEVGLVLGKEYAAHDLWEHRDLGPATSLKLTVQPHDCALYRVSDGSTPITRVMPHNFQDIPNSDLLPSNGLIHYWSLDQASGSTLAVDSIGGANVTLAGTTVFSSSSEIGSGALSLPPDGTSKCSGVMTPSDMLGQNQLTLSMWYKRACAGCVVETGQELGDDGEEIAIQAWGDGNLYGAIGGNGAETESYAGVPQNDTDWHLATLVFDGAQTGDANRLKLYVDGVQRTLGSFNRPVPASTTTVAQTFYIGATDCGQIHTAGSIDDVRVYNRALSATEVSNLYRATYSGAGEHADHDSMVEHERK